MIKQLVREYNEMSKPLKASVWFMASSIINKGIAFLTTPLFARLLTQEEYGMVGVYSTWVVILTIIITFELATGVFNKAMIKYEDDKDGYTSSSLILVTILFFFFFVIYLILRTNINKMIGLPPVMILLMFAEIISTTTWNLYAIRRRFEYEYREIVIVTVVVNIVATSLSFLLVVLNTEHRAEARVAGFVFTYVVVYLFFYIRILLKGKVYINKNYWKYSLCYNLPLIPHYLSQQVLNQSDRIMISYLKGNSDAGLYTLAYQVATVIQLVTNAVHVSFMPWCFQCLKNGESNDIKNRSLQIEILVGILCLTFSLFAPEFIMILGGQSYYSAVYIIPPISMSIVFLTMYSFFANIEFYFEKTKIVMFASVIVAIANVVLNLLFIPMYGFVAAGYTTLLCYILYATVHYGYMVRICKANGIGVPFYGKKMWVAAMVMVFLSISVSVIYQYMIIRWVVAMTSLICTCFFFLRNKNIFTKKFKQSC